MGASWWAYARIEVAEGAPQAAVSCRGRHRGLHRRAETPLQPLRVPCSALRRCKCRVLSTSGAAQHAWQVSLNHARSRFARPGRADRSPRRALLTGKSTVMLLGTVVGAATGSPSPFCCAPTPSPCAGAASAPPPADASDAASPAEPGPSADRASRRRLSSATSAASTSGSTRRPPVSSDTCAAGRRHGSMTTLNLTLTLALTLTLTLTLTLNPNANPRVQPNPDLS